MGEIIYGMLKVLKPSICSLERGPVGGGLAEGIEGRNHSLNVGHLELGE